MTAIASQAGSLGWRLGEQAGADELAVAVDGVEMDVERRIGGELLELLSDAREGLVMAHLLGEEFFEGAQEGWGCLRVLVPDLECQAQERQVEVHFLLLVSALVGEVACGFRRAAERGGAVLDHIVLALLLGLSSPTFLFPAFVFS